MILSFLTTEPAADTVDEATETGSRGAGRGPLHTRRGLGLREFTNKFFHIRTKMVRC